MGNDQKHQQGGKQGGLQSQQDQDNKNKKSGQQGGHNEGHDDHGKNRDPADRDAAVPPVG
jgi:hypothetical protein